VNEIPADPRPRSEAPVRSRGSFTRDRVLWVILFIGFALRLAAVLANPRVSPDGLEYSRAAQNILHGNGFSVSFEAPFVPCTIRDPLYSAFLAAIYGMFGVHTLPVYLLQLCCSLVALVVVYSMAMRYFGILAARITAALAAAHLGSIVWVADLTTETLYITLLLAGCWHFVHPSGRWPAGRKCLGILLLAAATLTRNEAALFCVALIFISALARGWREPGFKRAFLFLLLWLALISPWLWRNYANSHRVFLRDPQTMIAAVSLSLYEDFSDPSYVAVFQHPGGMSTAEAESHWERIRQRLEFEWKKSPLRFAAKRAVGVVDMWISPPGRMKFFGGTYFDTFTVIGLLLAEGRYESASGRALLYLLFGCIPLAASCAAARILWRRTPRVRWLLLYPAYISVVGLLVYPDRRYSLAGQYFLMPLFGWALSAAWKSHGEHRRALRNRHERPESFPNQPEPRLDGLR
jgi:4-amino-4-deoxy-L-arabinose transferase-like glycosyltransferase